MSVWLMNANLPSLFHLRTGALISCLIMLLFVHRHMGNVQASEHLDSEKTQMWLPNGLILHWCRHRLRKNFHTNRLIHTEHMPLLALLARHHARSTVSVGWQCRIINYTTHTSCCSVPNENFTPEYSLQVSRRYPLAASSHLSHTQDKTLLLLPPLVKLQINNSLFKHVWLKF